MVQAGETGAETLKKRPVEQLCKCNHLYLENHAIQCRPISLSIIAGKAGQSLGIVTIRQCATGLDLVKKVASHLGACVESISLCKGNTFISAFEAIGDQCIEDGNSVIVMRFHEPFDHDGKMICACCGYSRWCYYGYSAWDDCTHAITALCRECGGVKWKFEAPENDESEQSK